MAHWMRGTALSALVAAAVVGCDGGSESEDVLARAGNHRFAIEDAAALLVPQTELPLQGEVIEALADLWIDYSLLADEAAKDASMRGVDIRPLVEQHVEQETISRLRDEVIAVDTVVTEEELRDAWNREAPGATVRARHILLSYPQGGATPEQRDSIVAQAESLRAQIAGGADFEALAREHSSDPGSAAQGGDLGFFSRGQMVASFDSAAFAMAVGELSQPVESPYGVHIIRVEERQAPDFDEVADLYRMQYVGERVSRAELDYVEALENSVNVEVEDGAVSVVRELARNPDLKLSSRAGRRALATFDGGELTAAKAQEWIRGQSPVFRAQVEAAPDDQLDGLVRNLTRSRILLRKAGQEGIEISDAEVDSIRSITVERLQEATALLGLQEIEVREGQSRDDAVRDAVLRTLGEVLRGERDVIPLGVIGYALRDGSRTAIIEPAVERTMDRVAELRQSGPAPAPAPPPALPELPASPEAGDDVTP